MPEMRLDRSGEAVYQKELDELIKKFEAKGVILLVLQGNRNKSHVEFGCGALPRDIPALIQALEMATENLKNQFIEMIRESIKDKKRVDLH